MGSLSGFNAGTTEPAGEFTPLPAGDYKVLIMDSDWIATKAGTGKYLQLQFEVLDGPQKGRYVWARLNLENPSEKAVSIARSELSSICRAVGVLTPNDPEDLHNRPLMIKVVVREQYNDIKGYSAVNGTTTKQTAAKLADDDLPF